MSHTPGPWKVRARFDNEVLIPGYAPLDLGGVQAEENYETAQADARLIAAAPDLLAALETWAANRRDVAGDEWLVAIAEAAIAKARGES